MVHKGIDKNNDTIGRLNLRNKQKIIVPKRVNNFEVTVKYLVKESDDSDDNDYRIDVSSNHRDLFEHKS